jgi:UDP-2-acetamido-2,6-beta-L-arabino-hexul-4-ose reductase
MKTVGITGKSGFIGTHLFNNLGLLKNNYEVVDIKDEFFEKTTLLNEVISKCDIIVHLAAINRHIDPDKIYDVNVSLVKTLIHSLQVTKSLAHVIFASSIQEEKENAYGRSKRDGKKLLAKWAQENDGRFTSLIIPNVFGPFGKPFYNSFISTFSFQLNHNIKPKIDKNSDVNLIYIDELIREIVSILESDHPSDISRIVKCTSSCLVSKVLEKLSLFQILYNNNGIIPELNDKLELNLFNTFRSYLDLNKFFPYLLKSNEDMRGNFVEAIKSNTKGQVSFSFTKPGVTRGNHFHIRKIERFIVVKGEAVVRMRSINNSEVLEFKLNGNSPSFVDIPIWYTHNITNIGTDELITLFWINEFFDPDDSDTFFEKV